jgi:hypothetical protein
LMEGSLPLGFIVCQHRADSRTPVPTPSDPR